MKRGMKHSRRSGRTATEYFVAAVGLAMLVFIVAILATADSCRLRLDPDLGAQPSNPRPTPTP